MSKYAHQKHLLHVHVLAVFLQLPSIDAVETSVQIDHAGKSVGEATGTLRGHHIATPHPVGLAVGHQFLEQLVANLADATNKVCVESLEVETILLHPTANPNVGRDRLSPVVFAELASKIPLHKLKVSSKN